MHAHLRAKQHDRLARAINIIDARVIKTQQSRKGNGKNGFKMHANTDAVGCIKKMADTPGNVHDSQERGKLLVKPHGQAYADSTYANEGKRQGT